MSAVRLTDVALDPDDPVTGLRTMARRLHEVILDPMHRELIRMQIAEYPHLRETIVRLREVGLARNTKSLRDFFSLLLARGQMLYDDAEHATGNFTALAFGNFRLLLGEAGDGEDERLMRDVDFFVRGCGITASRARQGRRKPA